MMPPRGYQRANYQRELRERRGTLNFGLRLLSAIDVEISFLQAERELREIEDLKLQVEFRKRYPAFAANADAQRTEQTRIMETLFPNLVFHTVQ